MRAAKHKPNYRLTSIICFFVSEMRAKFVYLVCSCAALTEGLKRCTTPVSNRTPSKLSGSFFEQGNRKSGRLQAVDPVSGVGIEGCKLKSPSGVNMLPIGVQAGVFFGYWILLAGGALFFINTLDHLNMYFPDAYNYTKLLGSTVLGMTSFFTGSSKILNLEKYENIVPYKGAWGIWYLPGNLPTRRGRQDET